MNLFNSGQAWQAGRGKGRGDGRHSLQLELPAEEQKQQQQVPHTRALALKCVQPVLGCLRTCDGP